MGAELGQPGGIGDVFSELTRRSHEIQALQQVKAGFSVSAPFAGPGPRSIDKEKASGWYRIACPLQVLPWPGLTLSIVVITWSRIPTAAIVRMDQRPDLG